MKAEKIKNTVKAGLVLALSFLLFIGTGAAPATAVRAEALNAYDQTRIEDDLKETDLSGYPKDESALHCLIDGAGFMEYGYSNDMQLSTQYYGVYFYLYNPSERVISTRTRANVANMAVAYNAAGEPTEYANIDLTVLDHTENHRFYKLRATDASALLRREKEYAAAHGGERRYDVAGVQVWFEGDRNATDSRPGSTTEEDREGVSITYICTGYAAGCGAGEESTLAIRSKKLDSVKLDVHHTYYRADPKTTGDKMTKATTLTSVYFSVPKRYMSTYGKLQIIKAEWWEYHTAPVFAVKSSEIEQAMKPYLGYTVQGTYEEKIPFEIYQYLGPSDSGMQGVSYNYHGKSNLRIPRFDWLMKVNDFSEIISPETMQKYAYNYRGVAGDQKLKIGAKELNANLFRQSVDEGHTLGYNVKEFDARDESQWIDLNIGNTTNVWEQFLNIFRPNKQYYDFITVRDIKPIETVAPEQMNQSPEKISDTLLIAPERVEEFQNYYNEQKVLNDVVLFRFSASDYTATELEYHDDDDTITGTTKKRVYYALDTVYLEFDIIHLGFVKGDRVTIIPVVSNPIDMFPAITPPPGLAAESWKELLIWLIGITAVCLAGVIVTPAIKRAVKRKEE